MGEDETAGLFPGRGGKGIRFYGPGRRYGSGCFLSGHGGAFLISAFFGNRTADATYVQDVIFKA
jgi:hypothetical protein